jgi:hypothetical protein
MFAAKSDANERVGDYALVETRRPRSPFFACLANRVNRVLFPAIRSVMISGALAATESTNVGSFPFECEGVNINTSLVAKQHRLVIRVESHPCPYH